MKKTIDAVGLVCPQPVILANNALKDMAEGNLEIIVDNEIAVLNLKKLGNYLQLDTCSVKDSERSYRVIFEVSGQDSGTKEEALNCSLMESRPQGPVVVIHADHMGEGDEQLGKILLNGFLYALTQLEKLPETLILYNGGARLSVEGSEALKDLKTLEAQGVNIMTCGTCLNHMGLSDRLAVGSVTNLYEIAEILTNARSVVRP